MHDTAYAKLNLALHIRSRRADGYHELETLYAFLNDGDRLSAAPADGFTLTMTGAFAGGLSRGEDNFVLRAVRALALRCDAPHGLAFTLDKRLPVASGIGGGSADAAAALRLAAKAWGIDAPADLLAIAAGLGADVPACIESQSCIGSGIGDTLAPFAGESISGLPVLLINPLVGCPTGPVFQAWNGVDCGPLDPRQWRNARNDLEAPARQLVPEIGAVLAALAETRPALARMSGSGATCFGLYESPSAADEAQKYMQRAYPAWWTMIGQLR